jgi:hypothetical protein
MGTSFNSLGKTQHSTITRISEAEAKLLRKGGLLRSLVLRRIGTTSKTPSTTTGRNVTMYQKGDIVLLPFPFTDLTARIRGRR